MTGEAPSHCQLTRERSSWMGKLADVGRARRQFVPSPSCRRQGVGNQASSGARPSSPSVSHCPTSIPRPLTLILSPPHVGQKQKQNSNNLSVPAAEPRPRTRNRPHCPTVGHRPGPAMGAVSALAPTPHSSGGFASSSSSSAPDRPVRWGNSSGGHQPTLCPPQPAPAQRRGRRGTRRVREMMEAASEHPARLSRSCSQN